MANKTKRQPKEIVISENRAFEGIWIPKRLYITNKFNPRTKFFIVELKSLSKKGYCFATDKHFADFLGVSTRVVQTMIKNLKDDGYLETEYEYEKGTQAIKRRFLILTKKFLDEFYNETEPKRSEEKFDTPYEQNFNEPIEEKFDRGIEENCGEKCNNKIKYNNDSSNTDSSVTKEDKTLSNDNGEVKTSSSENRKKMSSTKTNLQKYLDKKADEQDMMKRLANICISNYDDETAREIFETIEHYFKRYTEKTGLIHPILTDKTLERITEKMDCSYDSEYSHFERLIGQDHAFMKMVDMFFDGDFGTNSGNKTNYNLPAFMTDGVLNPLGQRLFELGEVM